LDDAGWARGLFQGSFCQWPGVRFGPILYAQASANSAVIG